MKILHVTSSIDPTAGGVSQAVRSIIRGLAGMPIVNEVVSLDEPKHELTKGDNFRTYLLGPPKTSWRYSEKLLPWLKTHAPGYDLLLIHGLWQYHSHAIQKVVAAIKGKKPLVMVMPHGMLDPYFQQAKGRRIKAIRNWLYWKLIESKVVNGADKLLFTAQTEKEVSATAFRPYHIKDAAITTLGVEPPPPSTPAMANSFQNQAGFPLPANYLLFLGRIDEKKGVDLLAEAWLKMIKEPANFSGLMIAGPGLDTPFGQQIKAMLSNADNVWFPGMLTGDAKWAAFYGAEAFILPSHQENFGISVVEAMSCSKPVLISNKVNIWKEIIATGAGLVGNDDERGVFSLLEQWKSISKIERIKMSTAAAFVARHVFSVENAANQFLKAIDFELPGDKDQSADISSEERLKVFP